MLASFNYNDSSERVFIGLLQNGERLRYNEIPSSPGYGKVTIDSSDEEV